MLSRMRLLFTLKWELDFWIGLHMVSHLIYLQPEKFFDLPAIKNELTLCIPTWVWSRRIPWNSEVELKPFQSKLTAISVIVSSHASLSFENEQTINATMHEWTSSSNRSRTSTTKSTLVFVLFCFHRNKNSHQTSNVNFQFRTHLLQTEASEKGWCIILFATNKAHSSFNIRRLTRNPPFLRFACCALWFEAIHKQRTKRNDAKNKQKQTHKTPNVNSICDSDYLVHLEVPTRSACLLQRHDVTHSFIRRRVNFTDGRNGAITLNDCQSQQRTQTRCEINSMRCKCQGTETGEKGRKKCNLLWKHFLWFYRCINSIKWSVCDLPIPKWMAFEQKN